MRQFCVLAMFLLFSVGAIFSEDLIFELVIQINDDRLSRKLDVEGTVESYAPSAISFDSEENLYIVNATNRLLLKYSHNNGSLETIQGMEPQNVITHSINLYSENDLFYGQGDNINSFGWFNRKSGKQYSVDFFNSPLKNQVISSSFYMTENYFFQYLKDGGIICIPNPSLNNVENLNKILRNEEVTKFFKENSIEVMDELSIDDKYNLYRNGELVNKDYYNIIQHWITSNGYSTFDEYRNDNRNKGKPYPVNRANQVVFLGNDNLGNYYYVGANQFLLIFNSNGWCEKVYRYDRSQTYPTIDRSGNFYIMRFSSDNDHNIKLYKATNWPE